MMIGANNFRAWDDLAQEQDRLGEWDRKMGVSDGAVQARKARMFRQAAVAALMREWLNVSVCTCCGVPYSEHLPKPDYRFEERAQVLWNRLLLAATTAR